MTTHIVCGLAVGGDASVNAARYDLTPAAAERLLSYRGLIAAAQQVDEERFFGVEFFDSAVEFGVAPGAALSDVEWYRLPADPPPGGRVPPEFLPGPDGVSDRMVVVTVDGPFWAAYDSAVGEQLETPILLWATVEAAARGEAAPPVAPYDTGTTTVDDEAEDDDTETWLPLGGTDADIPETPLGGLPAVHDDTKVTDERDEF